MDGIKLNVAMVFGHSELKSFSTFEDGRMVNYGYRIDYDQNSNETGRTSPSVVSSIGWDDGSSFTKKDYRVLSQG